MLQVLIAACDTFRSGAVEQLRVHVRNLSKLAESDATGSVELYERGYGKDAAGIAKEAITYGEHVGLFANIGLTSSLVSQGRWYRCCAHRHSWEDAGQ